MNATLRKLAGGRHQVRWDEYERDPETGEKRRRQRAKNFRKGRIEEAREFMRRLATDDEESRALAQNSTFESYAKEWVERHAKVEKAPSTVAVDEIWIRVHLNPAFGKLPLGEISEAHGLALRAKLKPTHSPKTVNGILDLAKQIVKTAKLRENPFDGVKRLPVPETDFDYWTAEERDRFLAVAKEKDPELHRLALVAVHTGLRKGELAALTRGQLDFGRGIIRVDASYCPRLKIRMDRSKNRTVGRVPMSAIVHAALLPLKDAPADQRVFDPETFRLVARRFQRRAKAWGFRPIRFHDLRHSFASILVMAGVPLYTVQKLMRHKSISQTEKYAHLAPDYLADAIEAGCASNVDSQEDVSEKRKSSGRNVVGVVGFERDPTPRTAPSRIARIR